MHDIAPRWRQILDSSLHSRCVNTIKGLAMDGIQAANSGHPGMPMGAADMATVLWTRFLKFDPADPQWPDRDRFILSAGHGSMLLYSLLHLSGFDLPLSELKDFRQWGSKTPGHPEYGHTPGVETTTGPLGQGFGNGVGMAITERFLRENFGSDVCDHWIYGIVGDGDLMEGVAYEAASIAGHLGLGRLIFLFDDNNITIDGPLGISHSENVTGRLAATGWHVQSVDGHDAEAIAEAIETAKQVTGRPSLIACRTVIGQGSPSFEGTSRTHGAPLGPEEVAATKQRIGLDPTEFFATPDDVKAAFRAHDGPATRQAWEQRLAKHPRADEYMTWLRDDGASLAKRVTWPNFEAGTKLATRKASLSCLKAIVNEAPWVIGGSADLAGSNGTKLGLPVFTSDSFKDAATINFGIREHAMGAICNGIALHGGGRPYSATFLMFHDYQRPSVRLSGLMNIPVTWIYTHDSVFLGEDGPTHQPISTMLALRAIPNMEVWRPADAKETAASWQASLQNKGPTSLILTRQGLPIIAEDTSGAANGGYVLVDCESPDVCLLGTGSEVATCVDAAEILAGRGIAARVVSLPCRERFWGKSDEYKASVLPAGVPRVSVEAGVTLGWERWTGDNSAHIGIDTYGFSAPANVIAEKLGFTGDNIANVAQRLLGR